MTSKNEGIKVRPKLFFQKHTKTMSKVDFFINDKTDVHFNVQLIISNKRSA